MPVIFVVLCFIPFLYTSYPVTATLSVEAVHVSTNADWIILKAARLVGAVGAMLSGRLINKLDPGITSLGAEVLWPGFAQPTAILSLCLSSFINASTKYTCPDVSGIDTDFWEGYLFHSLELVPPFTEAMSTLPAGLLLVLSHNSLLSSLAIQNV